MSELFAPVVSLLLFLLFAAKRLLTYLHVFQQEEYDGLRFLRWVWCERAWDRRLSLALIVIGFAQFVLGERFGIDWVFPVVAGLAFLATAILENDPRKTAKKKLAMTARAKRIYVIAWVLLAVVAVSPSYVLFWVIPVQLIPLALVVANLILKPFEARVQRRYWREAHEKLGKLRPMVIGITGSYGKTSVKHILGHVLETVGPTLITPGSVNTAMGIARIVRERLQAHHRYFVVEMGAYGPRSIQRLCELAPPDFGVITAIGKAHYERFKSLETVAAAKFELAEAVQRKGGQTIVASDALGFAAPRKFAATHPEALVSVGDDDGALQIRSIEQEEAGVAVSVRWLGVTYELRAPLFGLHQGRNVALAFAIACSLGMAPEDVVASLRSVPQIAHRLEVKRQGSGAVLIDDAYNSNPVGFASALGVLDVLRRPGGRRILVTPGMVELGAEHNAEHSRIGRLAADHVDILLAVAPQRIAPLTEAFRAAAPSAEFVPCAAFAEAQTWLDTHLGPQDAVLIENDLPDLYERPLRL
jgi:UDP-N-acetylmuramoyl-tripeptide--D-alanyl-D-alanine ligase